MISIKASQIKTSSLRITKTYLLTFSGRGGVGGWKGAHKNPMVLSLFWGPVQRPGDCSPVSLTQWKTGPPRVNSMVAKCIVVARVNSKVRETWV